MEIYWDDDGQLNPAQMEMLNRVAIAAMEYCGCPTDSEVSISFMNAKEIRVLNQDYRGKDTATDVLSFPVNSELALGNSIALGDIVVSMEAAQQQAEEYGHDLDRELAFLVVHGMLHLLGYDHETPEDEAEMCAAQEEILTSLNISR